MADVVVMYQVMFEKSNVYTTILHVRKGDFNFARNIGC